VKKGLSKQGLNLMCVSKDDKTIREENAADLPLQQVTGSEND
jgi:hypothetical protein